jgi:hypothetical protein
LIGFLVGSNSWFDCSSIRDSLGNNIFACTEDVAWDGCMDYVEGGSIFNLAR